MSFKKDLAIPNDQVKDETLLGYIYIYIYIYISNGKVYFEAHSPLCYFYFKTVFYDEYQSITASFSNIPTFTIHFQVW